MQTRLSLLFLLLAGPCLRAQLQPPVVPTQNPLTAPKAVLGKMLFWEEQLSSNNSVACATCHQPEAGGADLRLDRTGTPRHPGPDLAWLTADDVHGSPGIVRTNAARQFVPDATFGLKRQVTGRTANSAIGAAYHATLFWDGRASTVFSDPLTSQIVIPDGGALESQALGPILSPVEMGNEGRTWSEVVQKLAASRPMLLCTNLPQDVQNALLVDPTYPALFARAFGDSAITPVRIAFAIASYERTLVPDQTPWDRFMRGNQTALTQAQQTGLSIFLGSGRCANCHVAPEFTDDTFHNLGLRPWAEDPGRMNTTNIQADRGAFKTPTLRNTGLKRRMLHNGAMPAFGDPGEDLDPHSMVNLYFFGGGAFPENLDPFILPLNTLGVTKADLYLVQDFVRFGLTDPRVAQGLPPFDHPTLRSSRVTARTYGPSLAGSSAPAPFLIDADPAFPGNSGFRVGIAGDRPSNLALLAWSFATREPALWASGIPVNLALPADSRFFVLGGPAGGPGTATWSLPIPDIQSYVGMNISFQVFTADLLLPQGGAASRGMEVLLR